MRPREGGRCWRARYRAPGWCAWPRSRLCNLRRRCALRQAAERWVCAHSSSRTTPRTAGRRCGTGRSAGAGAPRPGVPALAQLALAKSTRAAGRRTGSYAQCLLSASCDLRDARTCLSKLPFNVWQVDEGKDGRRLAAPGLMRGNGETVGLWARAALLPARLVCCVRGALAEREGRTRRMSAVGRICCKLLVCGCWYPKSSRLLVHAKPPGTASRQSTRHFRAGYACMHATISAGRVRCARRQHPHVFNSLTPASSIQHSRIQLPTTAFTFGTPAYVPIHRLPRQLVGACCGVLLAANKPRRHPALCFRPDQTARARRSEQKRIRDKAIPPS